MSPGVYQVMVAFPTVVDEARGTAALNTLVVRSGWQAAGLVWMKAPASGHFPAQSSARFTVNTLFPNGAFPVEAFAVAFRSWRALNVMFAHGGTFRYQGQTRYEDANALVTVQPGANVLTLHYEIRNPNLEHLSIVPPISPGAQAPARKRREVPLVGWALIAILGAALAWVLVYVLLGGRFGKRKPRRTAVRRDLPRAPRPR